MKLGGTPESIMAAILADCPEASEALRRARASVPRGKQEIYPYQAALLFAMAKRYNRGDARILELGTYYGYSAAVMAQAAPMARIITLNPTPWECESARDNLRNFRNVKVMERYSWDYLRERNGSDWDLIFVDGDHKQIQRDFPWWNKLTEGGLFLHHDYSPNGSGRPCPPAYRGLETFKEWLGRDFDVAVIDDNQVGMVGWYRRADDPAWEIENVVLETGA